MIVSKSREKLTLKAPCKINLHLKIRERRPDGFHNLESIFVPLDCADTLVFTPLGGNGNLTSVTMKAEGPFKELSVRGQLFEAIPQEKNLVYRAVEIFRRKTAYSGDISVEITKRIPPGSGLGGGSSDAAAAFVGLNTLAADISAPLPREELLDMAAQLGSDVPFFIPDSGGFVKAAWVSGRGEEISPLPPPPPLGVLLAFPGFPSHTGRAYGLLDTHRAEFAPDAAGKTPVKASWPPADSWNFTNDFLELFLTNGTDKEKQLYRTLLADLQESGASFTALSGSGSSCFGVFDSFEHALEAKKRLGTVPYTLEATFFLAS
jgi:4-diphosphocytidyl-2-C-methyl-D-erythritol kinase